MAEHGIDPTYLRQQYGTSEHLQARIDVHERYSERRIDFYGIVLGHLALVPGLTVLDVGCGAGSYHPKLAARGVNAVGLDMSFGMVRECRRQAADQRLLVSLLQADAQVLPFPDATFDRAMANHMLYHVPNIRAALREIRRVVKPGGRVVLTTNASDHMHRLRGLHREAALALGYTPSTPSSARFSLDHLRLVRSVFPDARVEMIPNAFLFPPSEAATAALQHYASGPIDTLVDRPPDNSHRPKLLAMVREKIQVIVEREGAFRVQKDAGCFVATA
jgi:ubiquinone/menaquinone biosynthesis C-methylase UbiE